MVAAVKNSSKVNGHTQTITLLISVTNVHPERHVDTMERGLRVMLIRFRLWKIRFSLYVSKVQDVIGVKSKLSNDRHVLMWDFDERTLEQVKTELAYIQEEYALPAIYIFEGSNPRSFLAYCFANLRWQDARAIVCATEGVDEKYIRLSIMRGYFALRITKKNGCLPQLTSVLFSRIPDKVPLEELEQFFVYEARQH